MKIIYPEELTAADNAAITQIADSLNLLKETAVLLYSRGVKDAAKAKRFLSAGKKNFLNPFGLFGMREAVKRITLARGAKERVMVFGDYDADGICATAILCGCLKEFGIEPVCLLPEREEGYGMNVRKILSVAPPYKPDLVITVDCGISDGEKIRELKKSGVDVIVTDHHEPPDLLPDCICVNPKIKGQNYGFDGLCGGGVAYKLGFALIGEKADAYLDFAALATVADSMDLIGENRDIVAEGLKIFNGNIRPVFRHLIGDSEKEITAHTLAYAVAPRVNAGGRMGDAVAALKLFTAENEKDIFDLSVKLNEYNIARQTDCEEVFMRAKEIITETNANYDRIILVRGGAWKAGVIGIVAAKLTETYNKPVIVFADCDGVYKGSARSVDGINIYEAVYASRAYLIAFGGHAQAAGLSVAAKDFDAFRIAINAYAQANFPAAEEKRVLVDMPVTQEISLRFAEEIELLAPFGVGNRRPLLAAEIRAADVQRLKENSPHFCFKTEFVEMLDFNGEKDFSLLKSSVKKTLVFELNLSVYRGRKSLKGFLKAVACETGDIVAADVDVFAEGLKLPVRENGVPENPFYLPEKKAVEIKAGYGTAFVVSDAQSLSLLGETGLKVCPFEITDRACENVIAVAPKFLPDGYAQAVYLDEPIFYNSFGGRAFRAEKPVRSLFWGLSAEREKFEETFNLLTGFVSRPYAEFYGGVLSRPTAEAREILFCAAVFSELGFFAVNNGIIKRNYGIKRPLTDSILYRKLEEKR